MTENHTSEIVLRIRITSAPRQDLFDEFDVRGFRVGETYEVPVRLASLLVIAGFAETTGGTAKPAKAADFSRRRFPKRRT